MPCAAPTRIRDIIMGMIEQGGILMWPLAAFSILALAIILERFIVFSTFGFPDRSLKPALDKALQEGSVEALEAVHFPDRLERVSQIMLERDYKGDRERLLSVLFDELHDELSKRLGLLGVIVRAAPLLGLLGTVLGMIESFSNIAATSGGVDMTGLAGGIWQALLTTAFGLAVAIPSLLAQSWFLHRRDVILAALENLADVAIALHKPQGRHA